MEKVVASDLTGLTCNSLRMVKDNVAQVKRFQATAIELIKVLNGNDRGAQNLCTGACWSLQLSQEQFRVLHHAISSIGTISSIGSSLEDCCKEFASENRDNIFRSTRIIEQLNAENASGAIRPWLARTGCG